MSEWVRKYFDCGVGFDLGKIEGCDTPYKEPLQGLLSRFIGVSRSEDGPCVLPIVDANKQVELLISESTPEQSAELRSIAHAYLGSAYALVGSAIVSTASDGPYAIILDQRPGGIIRIRVPRQEENPTEYQYRVYKAMNLVLELIDQYKSRPQILNNIQRPTGRVLRDLFIALRDENAESAWGYFEELRDAQTLSARNILFLEFQIYAGLGDWPAILDHPRLGDVISGLVPRRVATIFLSALETLVLRLDVLQTKSLDEVRDHLSSVSEFFYKEPDLEESDSNLVAWRTWATGAALFGNFIGVANIRERLGEEWFGELRGLLRLPSEEELPSAHDVDPIEGLLLSSETHETAIELLKCTLQGNDKQRRKIVNRLLSYPSEIIDSLRENAAIRMLWDGIVGQDKPAKPIGGWGEWFEQAIAEPESELLLQAVMDDIAYWDESDWDASALIRLLENASASGKGIVRNILPILLGWLEEHAISLDEKTTEALLLDLALDDVNSIEDISLARDLLGLFVAGPHGKDNYISMVEAVGEVWNKVKSVHGLTGMYDIFDLLLDAPCSDESARRNLWQAMQEFLLSVWQRLDKQSKVLAKEFSEELLGTSSQFPYEKNEESIEQVAGGIEFEGKKLAIYSLMEKAAQRAKTALEKLYPGLNVVLNHDHTATNALVHLSKHADYFIFSSRSAKHQAFYPVTSNRSDIIYPDGKGTMSIIRAFSKVMDES